MVLDAALMIPMAVQAHHNALLATQPTGARFVRQETLPIGAMTSGAMWMTRTAVSLASQHKPWALFGPTLLVAIVIFSLWRTLPSRSVARLFVFSTFQTPAAGRGTFALV